MGVKTARMAEKEGRSSTYYNKTPPVIAARCQIPQGDGNPLRLTAFASSPEGGAPSQALPRQLSQRESQAVNLDAEVLGTKRKLPAVLLPLPLGEVASPTGLDGEGARRQSYFKVSSVMRNFPTMPKAPPERKDSPRPGGDVAQRQKGESGTPQATEGVQPRPT